jgi:transcriptional regulator with XRE-family HTH domain
MPDATGPSIGDNIKRLRHARFSQTELAAAAGVSPDLIRKLEQGRRHSLSIPSLHAIARALDVDTGDLLTRPRPVRRPNAHAGSLALRRALTAVDDLIGEDPDVEPLTVAEARRTVEYGWAAYWAGRTHDELPTILPAALGQARAMVRAVPAAESAAAHDVAAEVWQIAACTLVHLGHIDSAHLALREALALAEHGDDELRPLAFRGTMAWLLLSQGRFVESHKVATAAAAGVAPSGGSPLPAWALYGSLLLSGATAAGRAQDRATAGVLLGEAEEAAGRTGHRNDYQVAFGPDQVLMQTVDVEVVTERYTQALDAAGGMPERMSLPLAARARHMADTALAHTRLGHDGEATDVLMRIKSAAPEWLQVQRQTRQIVRELRERASQQPRLVELARHTGLVEQG